MELMNREQVQQLLQSFANEPVYIHLETTSGAYASHLQEGFFNSGAFIRNVQLTFEHAHVTPDSPHRVGLKLPHGWVYAQGITHYTVTERDELLLAGLDGEGKLAVALQVSRTPFAQ